MNAREICFIARYEALVISRGFVFRVLVCLALLGIAYIQVIMQGRLTSDWTMVATSSSMPFVNAYLFNILQAFMLVFVVTDYGVRESRWGFLECIHARPVSNQDYFSGKVLGVVGIFSCLNVLSGVICSFVNVVSSEAPWNPLIYLFYFLTLTTPSLFFFVGLCFLITLVSRYKIFAQGILLLILYFTIMRLPEISHGSFDFMGSMLPNLFSEITGHPEMGVYLLQRFSFLLWGISFLFFSVSLSRRIPNSRRNVFWMRRLGCFVFMLGVLAGGGRFYSYERADKMREAFRQSFERHWDANTCRVREHRIRYQQEGKEFSAVSDMALCNPREVSLSRIVLFLNPGLKVSGVQEGERDLKFQRDHQVILIERELRGKDSVRLQLSYSGEIDERYCYLAVSDARYYSPRREDSFFNFGYRYAYVGNEFTWLTPECGWYPVAIPDRVREGEEPGRDYTYYQLDVMQPKERVVLSQGKVKREGDTWRFATPRPLEGISLCIGDYTRKRVQTSGFAVELYTFRKNSAVPFFFHKLKAEVVQGVLEEEVGHGFELTHITHPGLADSIAEVCFRRDWCYDRTSRLIVAELPLSLTSFHDERKGRSAWGQPGMMFYPERGSRGLTLEIPTCSKRQLLAQRSRYMADEIECEEGVLSRVVSSFMIRFPWKERENPFLKKIFREDKVQEGPAIEVLTCAFPLIHEPGTYITSRDYPFLDATCKELFWRSYEPREMSRQMCFVYEFSLEAREVMRDHSLKEIMSVPDLRPIIKNAIWKLKREELFDLLCTETSSDRLVYFLKDFYRRYEGEVSEEVFRQELLDSCGVDIGKFYPDWFLSCPKNVYQIKDEKITKVRYADRNEWIGEFKIKHQGDTKGYISIVWDDPLTWAKDYKVYGLEPGGCYQFRFPVGGDFVINTHVSRNMPGEMYVGLDVGADEEFVFEWGRDTCCSMFKIDPSFFEEGNDDCIIVDNESAGFYLEGPPRKWLQRLFVRPTELYAKPVSIATQTVDEWGKMYSSRYYGDSIRSAYGKLVKDGSLKAVWSAKVKNPGKYEVFALIHDSYMHYYPEGKKKKIEYHYTLEYDDVRREVILPLLGGEKGWISLGKFDFLPGEVKITLDDRGLPGQVIYADAVKLCKVVGE